MKQAPEPRRSTVWDRASVGREASAGYDLAANIIVGLGLGWLAQRFWPGIAPWGYVGGILLGSASGFYQLFKNQSRPKPPTKAGDAEQDHE
jgi:F0F1-type ATP synthase assembly protein I